MLRLRWLFLRQTAAKQETRTAVHIHRDKITTSFVCGGVVAAVIKTNDITSFVLLAPFLPLLPRIPGKCAMVYNLH